MLEAFTARQIMEAKKAALRTRAVLTVTAQTHAGQITTSSADDIRWSELHDRPEIYNGYEWIPVPDKGIEAWAVEERLNWRRPNGSVFAIDATDMSG